MRTLQVKICLLFSLLLFSANGFAAGYIGGGLGTVDYGAEDLSTFDDPIGFEFIGGTDISENVGLEVSFVNFGESSDGIPPEWHLDATSLTFGALLKAPVGPTADFFLKVGMHMWDIEWTEDGFGVIGENDGTDMFFGFGALVHLDSRLRLGARYMSYDFDGDDITMLSFNILYSL